MNFFGLGLGLGMLLAIGLGFAWVIHLERRLGYLWWPYLIGLGALLAGGSVFMASDWAAGLTGIFGASLIWGAAELKEQAVRAERGWYPHQSRKLRPPFAERIEKWKAPHL